MLRGGVSICWSWSGPAAQQGLLSYGFTRNLPWMLKVHNENGSGVVLTFELQNNAETRRLWPHKFCLLARPKVGAVCEIELEAHGEFGTTLVLHIYLSVSDIAAVKISGLNDRLVSKMNDAKGDALADGIQTFPDRTGRVYLNPEACSVIHDNALNRSINIVHHRHLDVVSWSPGPVLSVSMGGMPNNGYRTFVYVETAYATAPQKSTGGKPSRLAQIIHVAERQHSSVRRTGCG